MKTESQRRRDERLAERAEKGTDFKAAGAKERREGGREEGKRGGGKEKGKLGRERVKRGTNEEVEEGRRGQTRKEGEDKGKRRYSSENNQSERNQESV